MSNITTEELRNLIREVIQEINKEKRITKSRISPRYYAKQNNDIESLIGSIPFILLDKKIFQKTIDVIEFAEKIGIIIPKGGNRKKDEIIGRIITAIIEFPPSKTEQLHQAILQLKTVYPKKIDTKSFLEEWDKVIKNLKL